MVRNVVLLCPLIASQTNQLQPHRYRAPEVLLECDKYHTAVDMWYVVKELMDPFSLTDDEQGCGLHFWRVIAPQAPPSGKDGVGTDHLDFRTSRVAHSQDCSCS